MTVRKKITLGALVGILLLVALIGCAFLREQTGKAFADDDVHYISSAQDLVELAAQVNSDQNKLGEVYELTADVDLTGSDFYPIGVTNEVNHSVHHVFHGTFHGNGHTVTIDVSDLFKAAFIGNLGSSGSVSDLIVAGSVKGQSYAAGVVADNAGRIYRCVNRAEVTVTGTGSSTYAGGIAAYNTNTVEDCVNFGTVNASYHVGGLVGSSLATSSIRSSVNFGTVTANGSTVMYLGGVAGESQGSMIDCYTYAYINVNSAASSRYGLGSLVGTSNASNTYNNYVIDREDAFSVLSPVWSNPTGVENKFTKKTLFDFLRASGVTFTDDRLQRAFYEQGYGYLYAPSFLLETTDGKTTFKDDLFAMAFRIPLFSIGNGSESTPFVVRTDEEWTLFAENTRIRDYAGAHVILDKDFSVGDELLSCADMPFRGSFDGKDCSVTIEEVSGKNDVALFTYAQDCTIANLTIRGEAYGRENVAGAVANALGNVTLQNVKNTAYVTGKRTLGGLVASAQGLLTMENCVNEGSITCTDTGSVSQSDIGRAGGLVGALTGKADVLQAYNYGSVRSDVSGVTRVGGLFGSIATTEESAFVGLHNESGVSAPRSDYVGGLVGSLTAQAGAASLRATTMLAGVVGRMYVGGLIGNANGTLSITDFTVIAGIRGQNYVSGVAGITDGTLTLTRGFYTGKTEEVQGVGTAEFESDVLVKVRGGSASATSKVYYNGDDGNADSTLTGAESKNGVELTSGLFEGGSFIETLPTLGGGRYPYPTLNDGAIRQSNVLSLSYFASVTDTTFTIANEQHLRNFAYFCRQVPAYRGYEYVLTANVTLKRTFSGVPVFTGTFDGNGYVLTGCAILSDSAETAGFFGSLEGATIRGLRLVGGAIRADGVDYVGVIAGKTDESTTIEDSYATTSVSGEAQYAGGLVGYLKGTLTQSFYAGTITGTQISYAGGLVGRLEKTGDNGAIARSFFAGKVSSYRNAGGLVGYALSGLIDTCMVSGRVEGTGTAVVGGIIARAASTTVRSVVVLADIVGDGAEDNTKGAFFAVADRATESVTDCYYDKDRISDLAFPGVGDVADNDDYAKETDYLINDLSVYGFTAVDDTLKVGGKFNAAYNARYAKMLTAFEPYTRTDSGRYDATIATYALQCAELYLYGRDTASTDVFGSRNNPYLITKATQFAELYELTKYTDYANRYFRILNDIDMNETMLTGYGFGYFNPSDATAGFPFRGVVYGDASARPTISNVNVDKVSSGATAADTSFTRDYVGLFANVETGFTLRDLIFRGSVTGGTCVGGLVGYGYDVVIVNCLSYIDVTATGSQAGGFVGTAMGSFTVTGSICAGVVTAGSDAYGIVGDRSVTGAITANSWYVLDGNAYYETYVHNSLGSVLYDYSVAALGENLEIVSLPEGFGFLTSSETAYKGHILDTDDKYIGPAHTAPYKGTVEGNTTRYYCMRYCTGVTATAIFADGSSAATYATVRATGYFYVGEDISVTLGWTDEGKETGYKFRSIRNASDDPIAFTLEPAAGSVIVRFTMTEDTTTVKTVVERITDGAVIRFTDGNGVTVASGEEYDGTERLPVLFEGGDGDVEYYVASTEESSREIKNAGVYRVVVNVKEGADYVGTYETYYTVAKRTLSLTSEDALKTARFTDTVYERDDATRTVRFTTDDPLFADVMSNVANGESVTISASFTYASASAGNDVGLTLTSIRAEDENYYVDDFLTIDLGAVGNIAKKRLTLSLPYAYTEGETRVLERTFTGVNTKPTVDETVYEIGINWVFSDENGAISAYNVGTYELTATPSVAADANNYELVLGSAYAVKITPYVIDEFNFTSATDAFVYSGVSLWSTIEERVTYTSPIDNGLHAVTLTFYPTVYATEPCDDVINAGNYYAFPTPTDGNYVTDESIARTLIVVRKKSAGEINVTFRLNGSTVENGATIEVEDRLEICLDNDELTTAGVNAFDGTYRAGKYNFTTEYDETMGKWYLIPVAGEESVSFVLIGENATNYVDRSSATFTFGIAKKRVYAILTKDEFLFGDDIPSDLAVDYYYIDEHGEVGEKLDMSRMSGLEDPGIGLGTEDLSVGTYVVTFSGGSSDGYVFTYYTNVDLRTEKSIRVLPKPISVVVNDAGSKVYGGSREEERIPYTLAYVDPADNVLKTLARLPNGDAPDLIGYPGREAGEDVGEYELTEGTMREDNPNYTLSFTFGGKFTILRKNIVLEVMSGQGKQYGDEDGELQFVVADGYELVDSDELGVHDAMGVFKRALYLTRDVGEDVGAYRYHVSENAVELPRLNYYVAVSGESLENARFTITATRPIIHFEISGRAYHGDGTDEIEFRSTAVDKHDRTVEGTYTVYVFDASVQGRRRTTVKMGDTTVIAQFTPIDGNYETVSVNAEITVEKRPVRIEFLRLDGGTDAISDGTRFVYMGARLTEKLFDYDVIGLVEGDDKDTYQVTLQLDGEVKNVSDDGFTVSATMESDYYVLTGKTSVRCDIVKGLVTVTVANAVINYGESFVPEITYSGFAGGETANVLTKKATVENVPTESGYHSIKASGATARNYDFTYEAGVLTINRVEASSDGISIKGTLSPNYEITATTVERDTAAFEATAETMDKKLGANFFLPISMKMSEYVQVNSPDLAEAEEYEYTIRFGAMGENDVLYVVLSNGELVKVEEYEAAEGEDGTDVTFKSTRIVGALTYTPKTQRETIMGYTHLAIAGGIVLVVLILIIVFSVIAHKSRRKERTRYTFEIGHWK